MLLAPPAAFFVLRDRGPRLLPALPTTLPYSIIAESADGGGVAGHSRSPRLAIGLPFSTSPAAGSRLSEQEPNEALKWAPPPNTQIH